MAKKKVKSVVKKESSSRDYWFKTKSGGKWGWIPLNWKGWVTLFVLLAVNVFSAQYFNPLYSSWSDVGWFLIVLLISLAIFIQVSLRKTRK